MVLKDRPLTFFLEGVHVEVVMVFQSPACCLVKGYASVLQWLVGHRDISTISVTGVPGGQHAIPVGTEEGHLSVDIAPLACSDGGQFPFAIHIRVTVHKSYPDRRFPAKPRVVSQTEVPDGGL